MPRFLMPTKALRNKRIKAKTYQMVISYDLGGNSKCKGSNWVRGVFDLLKHDIQEAYLDIVFDTSRSDSKRSNAME